MRIKTVYIILLLTLCSLGLIAVSQHHTNAEINPSAQKKWIKKTMKQMKKFIPDDSALILKPSVTSIEGYYQMSFRLMGKGVIHFENGDWVYLVSASSHDNPKIGDLTLAMDNNGQFFKNAGHVCGGIIHFIVEQPVLLQNAQDFFESFVSDTDDVGWEKPRKQRAF